MEGRNKDYGRAEEGEGVGREGRGEAVVTGGQGCLLTDR